MEVFLFSYKEFLSYLPDLLQLFQDVGNPRKQRLTLEHFNKDAACAPSKGKERLIRRPCIENLTSTVSPSEKYLGDC